MFATSYDLDSGSGGVNMFILPPESSEPSYVASLTDNDTSRIMCLDLIYLDDDILMVTGGRDLKMWRQTRDGSTGIRSRDGSTGIRSRVLRLAPCHDSCSDT